MAVVDEAFRAVLVRDLGAAISGLMVYLGDRLGLYVAMAQSDAVTAGELAAMTGTDERYVQEWLDAQAATGYVTRDSSELRYSLPPEHAGVLLDDTVSLRAAFTSVLGAYADADLFVDAFRTGRGVAWQEHDDRLITGCDRWFGRAYWHTLLDGIVDGAVVADIGCGRGTPTVALAVTLSMAQLVGFDIDRRAVEIARKHAAEAGVSDRVHFDVASAKDYPTAGYDLIAFIDALNQFGDPVGAVVHARRALRDRGRVLVVEPRVDDRDPALQRVQYAFSTVASTMASRAQEVGAAIGAQAGGARLAALFEQAGFDDFRPVAETEWHTAYLAAP